METRYKIYPDVKIGKNAEINEFVVIGVPPKDKNKDKNKSGQETVIGDNAVIRSHSVIYRGNKIGDDFQTGHSTQIRENNVIGNNVSIGTKTVVEHNVEIGDNVRIHSQAFIPEFSRLEKDCWIGPNVVLTNALYPTFKGVKENLKGPVIKRGAIVGANSTILPGLVIGENSLIGAGSVVTKDVPPNKVVLGNPAKVTKNISEVGY
ncbi:transferase [Candidatus Woesearchaeota archaeon]|nr:transferase [Candidatus Woesearchaeota archaeon]|tara:strand:- start:22814 stop:23431 length:618 start_codon:yes stop_codon:yes gene_type:complete